MSGAIVVIAKIFPFKNSLDIATSIIKGTNANLLIPFAIVFAYLAVVIISSILVFKKKMKE